MIADLWQLMLSQQKKRAQNKHLYIIGLMIPNTEIDLRPYCRELRNNINDLITRLPVEENLVTRPNFESRRAIFTFLNGQISTINGNPSQHVLNDEDRDRDF